MDRVKLPYKAMVTKIKYNVMLTLHYFIKVCDLLSCSLTKSP